MKFIELAVDYPKTLYQYAKRLFEIAIEEDTVARLELVAANNEQPKPSNISDLRDRVTRAAQQRAWASGFVDYVNTLQPPK